MLKKITLQDKKLNLFEKISNKIKLLNIIFNFSIEQIIMKIFHSIFMKINKLMIKGTQVDLIIENEFNYINLIDIAKYKTPLVSRTIVMNWLRTRSIIEFLGVWEKLYNPNFNVLEFEYIKNNSGSNTFTISPTKWVEKTNAIGIFSKLGKIGGVYAHEDIALEFASWISPEFKLYMIKEFRRLKELEMKNQDWNLKRALTKINYSIHTHAIKTHLIPKEINSSEDLIYATEADILNLALFGTTSKDWKKQNPKLDGNLRDYANVTQLVCLSNLENINALFIKNNLTKEERLKELNKIAIEQMTILVLNSNEILKLEKITAKNNISG